jgi:hypothetical protein
MRRVLLTNIKLGDPADVEIYAGAAIWDWMAKPQFIQLEQYGITTSDLHWNMGPMTPTSITIDIWVEVDEETETLLKLSGLCQLT